MDKNRITYNRTCAHAIQYHIVLVTEYRKRVLTPAIMNDLIAYLHDIVREQSYDIIEANGEEDHIHLLIKATPQDHIPNIIKQLKGPSAREMFKQHPEIKDQLSDGHFWSPSYFVATPSDNTAQQIADYIRKQGDK